MMLERFLCRIGFHAFELVDYWNFSFYCRTCGRRWTTDHSTGRCRELKRNSWTEFLQ
jgi:hypothetical protein